MVVFSPMNPLHSAYRKSERAKRCFRLPVMCVDSSLRYNCTSTVSAHAAGSGYRSRWVSALRRASASINRTALSAHARLTSLHGGAGRAIAGFGVGPVAAGASRNQGQQCRLRAAEESHGRERRRSDARRHVQLHV
ncbi:Uncharacterised protein [Mycobacteroides abscessus subsp. abscessus]|nr:Uncharacterised protein [Mycobacteroides abscessus subsp. abscessus]